MVDRNVTVVAADVANRSFLFIHGDRATDPQASLAERKLFDDFERLGISRKSSEALIAFAETFHSFEFRGEELSVSVEGDPGVITITAAHGDLIEDLMARLLELGGYNLERRT